MNPEPITKALYKKAKSMGITKIQLEFQGGSDEGYLNVGLQNAEGSVPSKSTWMTLDSDQEDDLKQEIEEWAWEAYSYSGAGDGSDYGDDITYDLVENTVETQEWFTSRDYQGSVDHDLLLEESEPEEDPLPEDASQRAEAIDSMLESEGKTWQPAPLDTE